MGRRKKYRLPDTALPPELERALLAEMAGSEGMGVSKDPSDGGWVGDPAKEVWDKQTLEARIREMEQEEVRANSIRQATELVGAECEIIEKRCGRSGPKPQDTDEIIDPICWAYYCEWYRSGKTSWRAAIAAGFPNFAQISEDRQDACYRRLMNRVTAEADRRLVRITWSLDWQPLRDSRLPALVPRSASSKNEES